MRDLFVYSFYAFGVSNINIVIFRILDFPIVWDRKTFWLVLGHMYN